jgi:hypothetical protein
MHATLRPYATAGVALVGASVIAVTPVATPLPDVHIPTLRAAVALTQVTDPITTLVQVATTAVTNLQALAQVQIASPAPGLVQFLANQAAYANILSTALTSAGQSIAMSLDPTNPTGLTQSLTMAGNQILSGDINDGINTAITAIGLFAALPLIDVLEAVGQVGTDITTNLQALITPTETLPLFLALGVLGPVNSVISAFGFSAQQILDSVTAGNLTDTVNALLDGPINIIGGFLNGFGPGIIGANGGILTPQDGLVMGNFSLGGPIGFFQELQADIASALATAIPPVSSAQVASPQVAAVPKAGPMVAVSTTPANTVTANTAKTANTPSATGANVGSVAKVTTGNVTATTTITTSGTDLMS